MVGLKLFEAQAEKKLTSSNLMRDLSGKISIDTRGRRDLRTLTSTARVGYGSFEVWLDTAEK